MYLDDVGDDNLQLTNNRDPGRRLQVDGVDETVLLDQPEHSHAHRHHPLPHRRVAGPPHREEAGGAAERGGQTQVEEDDRFLNPLGDELGGDHAHGGGETCQAHHDVACRGEQYIGGRHKRI
jgi:hypothetical protein